MSRDALGELEHQVLLATLRLQPDSYSVSVVLEIEERTGRTPAQSAVFIALRRLEAKGMLRSRLGRQNRERGRLRRYFELTPAGMAVLADTRQSLLSLWDGVAVRLDTWR